MFSYFLVTLSLVFFSLAAMSSTVTVRESGRQIGQEVQNLYGSPESLDQRIYKPLTSSVSMQTIDGDETFGARMSCDRQDDFMKIVILPNRTSDVETIRVYREKNTDGSYRVSNVFNGPFAAVCTNGLLLCDAGSTGNCRGRRWSMNGQDLELEPVDADLVGGCYCYNTSCGHDLLTNNREKVIEDIGLGIVHVLDDVYPRLSIGDHHLKKDKQTMTFSGQLCAQSDCSDGIDNDKDGRIDYPLDTGCSSQTDPDESNFQDVPPEQHYERPDDLSAVDVSDASPNSLFYKVGKLDISSQYSDRSCQLSRQFEFSDTQLVLQNALTVSQSLAPDAFAVSSCGLNCLEYRMGKLGNDYLVSRRCGSNQNTATFTVNRPDLIQSVTFTEVNFDDYTSIRLNNQIVWSEPAGWMGVANQGPRCRENQDRGRFTKNIDVTSVFTSMTPGGTLRWDQTIYYRSKGSGWSKFRVRLRPPSCDIAREFISGDCSSLDNDPECTLQQEVVDGVTTWDQYYTTGKSPGPSGKSFSGCTRLITRPWWVKKRTYGCYAKMSSYDLSAAAAADRYKSIHDSFDSRSGEFSDRRKNAQGNYQVHSETAKLPAADSSSCIQVCKTRKPRPGVSMGSVGAVTDTPAWDYSYYECDADGLCPNPSDETVIETCGCGSSFQEAFLYMQMIYQTKHDFICTQ